jgi:hypothetical protein
MGKQLFISHAWGKDGLERDNHQRCKLLYNKIIQKKYSAWIDDNEIYGNIDYAIMRGINNAKAIIVCLTETYCNKINNAVLHNLPNDNCYKEWNYSLFKQKIIIPVIMEPNMRNIYLKQEGVVQMYFNSTLYIDASEDLDSAVEKICFTLKNNCIYSEKFTKKFNNMKKMDKIFTILNNFKENINSKNNNKNNSKNNNKNNSKNKFILDNEIISDVYNKNNSPLKYKFQKVTTPDRHSPLDNKLINFQKINSKDNIAGLMNNSGRDSPIRKEENNLVQQISNNLSPIGKKNTMLSPLSGLSNRISFIEDNLNKTIKKNLKKDISEIKKDLSKDLKKNIQKDIQKDIQKNFLTGMIINTRLNNDESDFTSDKDNSDSSNINSPII